MQTCAPPPSLKKKGKLTPLGENKFWDIVTFDRKTQAGIKITYVGRGSCNPCRTLPLVRKQVEQKNGELAAARDNRDPNCVDLETRIKKLEGMLERLTRHEVWYKVQRPYITKITRDLSWGRRPGVKQVKLDFGKKYASDSRAVKSLVMVVYENAPNEVACGQDHVRYSDNWFRGSSCGIATVRMCEHVFADLETFSPGDHTIWSSDTGNGFRGAEFFFFLSCTMSRYRVTSEWIGYCPNHANSACDQHIGNLEVAIVPIKKNSRIIEPAEFAAVSITLPNTSAYCDLCFFIFT